jgi:retron-type reverse transcriptase
MRLEQRGRVKPLRSASNWRRRRRMSAVKPFTIPKRLVSDAWKAVKANAGSAGVDKETMARASERDGVLS